jgi:hypothetical protein
VRAFPTVDSDLLAGAAAKNLAAPKRTWLTAAQHLDPGCLTIFFMTQRRLVGLVCASFIKGWQHGDLDRSSDEVQRAADACLKQKLSRLR